MSIKLVADSRDEFAEDVRESAKEVDGKFEMDAAPVLAKRKELLGKNAGLRDRVTELEGERDEWKGKAKIPSGQKLVSEEIAELGEAAKAAEISKDEMPTLKTAKADLQQEIDSMKSEKQAEEIADALKWKRDEFKRLAKDVSIVSEDFKDGEKTVKKYFVAGKDADGKDTKTAIADDANFKPFLSSLQIESSGDTWIEQSSGKDVGDESGKSVAASFINSTFRPKEKT